MSQMNWVIMTFSVAAITSLMRNRFHLLIILLSLEALMLSLIVQNILFAYNTNMFYISSLIILSLSACEASMGLALLVSLIRARGNQSMKVLSMQTL